jgi:hypothetical protein
MLAWHFGHTNTGGFIIKPVANEKDKISQIESKSSRGDVETEVGSDVIDWWRFELHEDDSDGEYNAVGRSVSEMRTKGENIEEQKMFSYVGGNDYKYKLKVRNVSEANYLKAKNAAWALHDRVTNSVVGYSAISGNASLDANWHNCPTASVAIFNEAMEGDEDVEPTTGILGQMDLESVYDAL